MNDLVEIWHPGHPGVRSKVSRSAYERRSRQLGWRIVEDGAPARPPEPDQRDSLVDHEAPAVDRKAELLAHLEAAGIRPDRRLGVKKLQELVDKANQT